MLTTADRFWWARTIRRADVVDLALVRAQLPGQRVTPRSAVRAYVRGGFRSGLTLNPLFLDQYVSAQLPDSDRVPALYAYLIADATNIDTTIAWKASRCGGARTPKHADPGTPFADAWKTVREGGALRLCGRVEADIGMLHRATLLAFERHSAPASSNSEQGFAELQLAIALDDADSGGEVLDVIADLLEATPDERLSAVLDVHAAPPSIRVATALLALADRRIRMADSLPSTFPQGTVVLRREPGATITVETLQALRAAAAEGPVAPLLLSTDGTIAAAGVVVHEEHGYPLLAGFPAEDARALGTSIPTAVLAGPVSAVRSGDHTPPRVLITQSVTVSPSVENGGPGGATLLPGMEDSTVPALPRRLTFEGWTTSGPVISTDPESFHLPEGKPVPRLRWGIKTASPAGPTGESWGDTHFARALAAALERLGQYVAVDALAAAHRPSTDQDDVSLVLRGPQRIEPPRTALRLMWIISHPNEISAGELADFDHVFAASRPWSRAASDRFGRDIEPLLQCTDATRFRPTGLQRDASIVFVGTARGIHRPAVVGPVRAGIPLEVHGPDWRGYIPARSIASTGIPNDDLPARYESAGVVLNDHWPEMQRNGFISNRPYDVLAAGGRVISDDVEGLKEEFAGAVPTFSDEDTLVEMLRGDLDSLFPAEQELARVAAIVRERDSFDARARALLDAVLRMR